MTTLVLGATGFLGGAVARALWERGEPVRGLTRGRSGRLVPDLPIEWATADLADRAALADAMRGARRVVHAAGHYPKTSLDRDAVVRRGVAETRDVLDAAREAGVERLVYLSSPSTLGPPRGALVDEGDLYLPGSVRDAYFDVKWAMESEILRSVVGGLDAVVLVPTIVFGPGDVKPTSGAFLLRFAKGELPAYVEGDLNVVDVRAVADATATALEKGRAGERYILGGVNTTVDEVLDVASRVLGVPKPERRLHPLAAYGAAFASEVVAFASGRAPLVPLEFVNMLRHGRHVDATKARRELGLPPTDLESVVREAVDWFRAAGSL